MGMKPTLKTSNPGHSTIFLVALNVVLCTFKCFHSLLTYLEVRDTILPHIIYIDIIVSYYMLHLRLFYIYAVEWHVVTSSADYRSGALPIIRWRWQHESMAGRYFWAISHEHDGSEQSCKAASFRLSRAHGVQSWALWRVFGCARVTNHGQPCMGTWCMGPLRRCKG